VTHTFVKGLKTYVVSKYGFGLLKFNIKLRLKHLIFLICRTIAGQDDKDLECGKG